MDRNMIDAASGGALVDKTPAVARDLIANMAANSQQFGMRSIASSRSVYDVHQSSLVDQQRMEHRLDELTSLVRQLAVTQHRPPSHELPVARVCGICACPSHPTDAYPTLYEESSELPQTVATAGIFWGKPQF